MQPRRLRSPTRRGWRSDFRSLSSEVSLSDLRSSIFRLPSSRSHIPPSMSDKFPPWICCQLGAREHYAVPRAILAAGKPCHLLTEAWVQPDNALGMLKRNLHERYHSDLANAPVAAWNAGSIAFELRARFAGLLGWPLVIARNKWFQRQAVRRLEDGRWKMEDRGDVEDGSWKIGVRKADFSESNSQLPTPISPRTLFAYSYAALEIFRWAKQQGWRTVLGQIDPGPREEGIVARLYAEKLVSGGTPDPHWQPAPPQYWDDWREECKLADRIVVNSTWSQRALIEEGVPAEKIRVIPLAYSHSADGRWEIEEGRGKREYPERFTAERPLRVLFLGQINLRKGVGPLLEAARLLRDEPIEFWMVGPIQIEVPADLRNNRKFHWTGPVPRSSAANYYRDADVFLFPTFSDGFGLTQLEAQACKLPIIASNFCGEVVEDGRNGFVLPEVSATAIADALRSCLTDPARLREFSKSAVPPERFGLKRIGEQLLGVFD